MCWYIRWWLKVFFIPRQSSVTNYSTANTHAYILSLNSTTNQPPSCGKTSITAPDIHLLNYWSLMQGVSKRMTRFQIIISNNENVLQLQNKLQTINLLAMEFFLILARPVFKMWVIRKPNKVALWNKRHFEEKKMEIIEHV